MLSPLLDGQGASGVVVQQGVVLASWRDPARTETAFRATKSCGLKRAGRYFRRAPWRARHATDRGRGTSR
ncbi:hypothetical protein ABT072_26710 [Streptomyces sp. NPDC002589]|uniref:hypothetical protein n=1 Tax=Streptomyces sp. NPDC002589 TaxID=3154420 RepID=UPI00331FDCA2